MKAKRVRLAHATDKGAEYLSECADLTQALVRDIEEASREHGWPIMLDSMLSAYYTLAMEQMGPTRVVEILTDLADETLRMRQ